ncbi:MAG: hypothetical protein OXC68_00740 [Aestuariivita sp.]|nr:hypothetical protein [Aestuariivita sp.]
MVAEEDAKRLLRHRERLVRERHRYRNRIGGRLRLHGIPKVNPAHPEFEARLAAMMTGYGPSFPPRRVDEIRDILMLLKGMGERLTAVEAEKKRLRGTADFETAMARTRLRGIGPKDAVLLTVELFYRTFNNHPTIAQQSP